jgi:predicted transcriptional regulator
MCKILLSINPEHVENILNGTKLFEFRKIRCKTDVDKIVIYATSPIMRVVAEVEVENVIEGNLDEVWKHTKKFSGINRSFYNKYYNGKNKAVAYKLRNVKKYKKQKLLSEYGLRCAPQSFVYL